MARGRSKFFVFSYGFSGRDIVFKCQRFSDGLFYNNDEENFSASGAEFSSTELNGVYYTTTNADFGNYKNSDYAVWAFDKDAGTDEPVGVGILDLTKGLGTVYLQPIVRVDPISHAQTSIEIEKTRINDGYAFRAFRRETLGNGGSSDILIRIGSSDSVHFKEIGYTVIGGQFDMELYEGPTISSGGEGTPRSVFNMNRHKSIESVVSIFDDPTIDSGGLGTVIDELTVPGDKIDTFLPGENEQWVLKQNTDYLMRITNLSGGSNTYFVKMFWYEYQ